MVTLQLKNRLVNLLRQNDDETALFEAGQILKWVAGENFVYMPDEEISEEMAEKAADAAKRRIKGEPLQYILGEWDFYGLTFKLGEGVFIPRPETEILVEMALESLPENGFLTDLCSGSGCIPIAVAKNSSAKCRGIEISPEAMSYFRENIRLHGLETRVTAIEGDVTDAECLDLTERSDVITANPPYLTAEDMSALQKELRREPEIALFGGRDGLDYYRDIFRLWKSKLKKGGAFLVEAGDKQADLVKGFMEKAGLECEIFSDFSGIKRIVKGISV